MDGLNVYTAVALVLGLVLGIVIERFLLAPRRLESWRMSQAQLLGSGAEKLVAGSPEKKVVINLPTRQPFELTNEQLGLRFRVSTVHGALKLEFVDLLARGVMSYLSSSTFLPRIGDQARASSIRGTSDDPNSISVTIQYPAGEAQLYCLFQAVVKKPTPQSAE